MHPCRGEKARSRQLTRTLVRRHGLARQVPYRWRSLRIGHFSEVIRGHPKPIEVIRSKNLAHPPIFPSLFEPISEPIQVNPNLSAAIRSNPRILTTKIRTYPRLGEQKSEPIRGYPNLSETIRTTAFFLIGSPLLARNPSKPIRRRGKQGLKTATVACVILGRLRAPTG